MESSTKAHIDITAGKNFWQWFSDNEEWIKANLYDKSSNVMDSIDEKLIPVFPYFKKELSFQLGYKPDMGVFYFYCFHDNQLKNDAEILKTLMPENLAKFWSFKLKGYQLKTN